MATPTLNLSDSDKEFALRVLVNQKSKAVVDWETFAPKAGLASANSASSRWSKVEKKLIAKYGSLRETSVASSTCQSTNANTNATKRSSVKIKDEGDSPSSSTTSNNTATSQVISPRKPTVAARPNTGRNKAAVLKRKAEKKAPANSGVAKNRYVARTAQNVVQRQQQHSHAAHAQAYTEVASYPQAHSHPGSGLHSSILMDGHSPVILHTHPRPPVLPSQQQISNRHINRNVVDPRMIEIKNSSYFGIVDQNTGEDTNRTTLSPMDFDARSAGMQEVLEVDMEDGDADAYGEIDIDA